MEGPGRRRPNSSRPQRQTASREAIDPTETTAVSRRRSCAANQFSSAAIRNDDGQVEEKENFVPNSTTMADPGQIVSTGSNNDGETNPLIRDNEQTPTQDNETTTRSRSRFSNIGGLFSRSTTDIQHAERPPQENSTQRVTSIFDGFTPSTFFRIASHDHNAENTHNDVATNNTHSARRSSDEREIDVNIALRAPNNGTNREHNVGQAQRKREYTQLRRLVKDADINKATLLSNLDNDPTALRNYTWNPFTRNNWAIYNTALNSNNTETASRIEKELYKELICTIDKFEIDPTKSLNPKGRDKKIKQLESYINNAEKFLKSFKDPQKRILSSSINLLKNHLAVHYAMKSKKSIEKRSNKTKSLSISGKKLMGISRPGKKTTMQKAMTIRNRVDKLTKEMESVKELKLHESSSLKGTHSKTLFDYQRAINEQINTLEAMMHTKLIDLQDKKEKCTSRNQLININSEVAELQDVQQYLQTKKFTTYQGRPNDAVDMLNNELTEMFDNIQSPQSNLIALQHIHKTKRGTFKLESTTSEIQKRQRKNEKDQKLASEHLNLEPTDLSAIVEDSEKNTIDRAKLRKIKRSLDKAEKTHWKITNATNYTKKQAASLIWTPTRLDVTKKTSIEDKLKEIKEIRNNWQQKESVERSSVMSLSSDGIDKGIIDKCDGLERQLTIKLMILLRKEMESLNKEMESLNKEYKNGTITLKQVNRRNAIIETAIDTHEQKIKAKLQEFYINTGRFSADSSERPEDASPNVESKFNELMNNPSEFTLSNPYSSENFGEVY